MSEEQAIQMQEEANKIMESIESQRLDQPHAVSFVYALFVVVGVSMVFENFVRSYREQKRKKKETGQAVRRTKKKACNYIWNTYLSNYSNVANLLLFDKTN